jgi:hypothetical protein
MQKKSEIDMARAERSEIIRTITRLKYRLLANRELNDILPDSLNEFELSLQNGELKTLDLPEVLNVINTKDN